MNKIRTTKKSFLVPDWQGKFFAGIRGAPPGRGCCGQGRPHSCSDKKMRIRSRTKIRIGGGRVFRESLSPRGVILPLLLCYDDYQHV